MPFRFVRFAWQKNAGDTTQGEGPDGRIDLIGA
jgi:hypothetical protein